MYLFELSLFHRYIFSYVSEDINCLEVFFSYLYYIVFPICFSPLFISVYIFRDRDFPQIQMIFGCLVILNVGH